MPAAVLLAGCGQGQGQGTGPFENHDAPNQFCAALPAGDKVVTDGATWSFRSAGPTALIDKVTLSHPRNLQVLAAWAVLDTGTTELYGNYDGMPPRTLPAGVTAEWARRQHADGARITRSRGNGRWELVLVIKLTARAGSTDGLDVYYHTSRGSYYLHMIDALEMHVPGVKGDCPAAA